MEYLNSVFNKDETVIEFIATRLRNLERCHSTLRQMDSLEHPNADKFIILDVSDNDALQFLLRQVPVLLLINNIAVIKYSHQSCYQSSMTYELGKKKTILITLIHHFFCLKVFFSKLP